MAQALDGIASDVEQLNERLRELERRVSALEGQPARRSRLLLHAALPVPPESLPAMLARLPGAEPAGWGVPVFGKAVLGIAGAYLLRAIAESGTIPHLPVLVVAIAVRGHVAGLGSQDSRHESLCQRHLRNHGGTDPLASAVGIHSTFSGSAACVHSGCAGCVRCTCLGTGLAAKPAGDSVGGNFGGGGHGSGAHRRDARACALYGWLLAIALATEVVVCLGHGSV